MGGWGVTGGPCPHSKGLRVYPEGQGLGLQEGQCQDLTGLGAHPGLYVQSWGVSQRQSREPLSRLLLQTGELRQQQGWGV